MLNPKTPPPEKPDVEVKEAPPESHLSNYLRDDEENVYV